MNHHPSCKPDNVGLFAICSQCGEQSCADDLAEALAVLLDAVNEKRVTVGDCNMAKRALTRFAFAKLADSGLDQS